HGFSFESSIKSFRVEAEMARLESDTPDPIKPEDLDDEGWDALLESVEDDAERLHLAGRESRPRPGSQTDVVFVALADVKENLRRAQVREAGGGRVVVHVVDNTTRRGHRVLTTRAEPRSRPSEAEPR